MDSSRVEVVMKLRFLIKRVAPGGDEEEEEEEELPSPPEVESPCEEVFAVEEVTGVIEVELEVVLLVERSPSQIPLGAFSRYKTLPPNCLYSNPLHASLALFESSISTIAIVPLGGTRSRVG